MPINVDFIHPDQYSNGFKKIMQSTRIGEMHKFIDQVFKSIAQSYAAIHHQGSFGDIDYYITDEPLFIATLRFKLPFDFEECDQYTLDEFHKCMEQSKWNYTLDEEYLYMMVPRPTDETVQSVSN